MPASEHTVIVNKPVDVVFKNLACLKGCINWSSMLRDTEKLDEGPIQPGTRYKHVSNVMGMSSATIVTVRLYNPPHQFAFGTNPDEGSLHVDNKYTFTEVPEGTQVRLVMTLTPKEDVIGKLDADLVLSRLQKQMEHDLNTFKELVEADVTVHA